MANTLALISTIYCSFFYDCGMVSLGKAAQPFEPGPGWNGFRYMFVFGDSYSTTSFDISGMQPSTGNPLGNPPYPGYTSSNGPNWVDYITTKYNSSSFLTYDLAVGGATIDSNLVKPFLSTVLSLKDQVQISFLPNYVEKLPSATWKSDDTLFAFFIGINDIGNTYIFQNESLIDLIYDEYSQLVEKVYSSGARNFLFLDVPPVQRSPLTTDAQRLNPTGIALEEAAIESWNTRLRDLTRNLRLKHLDTTVIDFSTYDIFTKILDDPESFPQTRFLKNMTAYCSNYANGTPQKDTLVDACGIPVDQYFWLNSLHPTFPVHDAMAARLAETLTKEKP